MTFLDQTDKDILKMLQANARIPLKEIATQLNLTRTPIHERIRKMERAGVISKYVTLLDPKKIDKGLIVFCYITLNRHGLDFVNEFQQKVSMMEPVMECYHISGNYDFILKIMVKDIEEYQSFVLKDLSEIKNISNIQSSFVLGEIKHSMNFMFEKK